MNAEIKRVLAIFLIPLIAAGTGIYEPEPGKTHLLAADPIRPAQTNAYHIFTVGFSTGPSNSVLFNSSLRLILKRNIQGFAVQSTNRAA
jgi:hypothetical protein